MLRAYLGIKSHPAVRTRSLNKYNVDVVMRMPAQKRNGGSEMKKLFICAVLVVVLVTLASCAASPNEMVKTPDAQGEVAGFWQGLWQGFISPFAFLLSLFKDNIGIYEVHNNGGSTSCSSSTNSSGW